MRTWSAIYDLVFGTRRWQWALVQGDPTHSIELKIFSGRSTSHIGRTVNINSVVKKLLSDGATVMFGNVFDTRVFVCGNIISRVSTGISIYLAVWMFALSNDANFGR